MIEKYLVYISNGVIEKDGLQLIVEKIRRNKIYTSANSVIKASLNHQ